jgi:hypothetical protein
MQLTQGVETPMTDAEKIWAILRALDDRQRGLLDPAGLVDTLLAVLSGHDPYGAKESAA